jgi:predicted amidohydrolase YtcJ
LTDLILHNANVLSMEPAFAGTRVIAVKAGKIEALAMEEGLSQLKGRHTRLIDCGGRTVVPGWIDAHCHLASYAESLVSVNLSPLEGIRTIADIREKVRAVSAGRPPGAWIRAKGYNEFYLSENRHPNRCDLDAATSVHPVKLTHRSGHAHVLNSLALRMVGITPETGDPTEGLIDRDLETGEPTGVLYGMGAFLGTAIPPVDSREMEEGVKLAGEKLLSCGITSIQDASSFNDLHRWNTMVRWKEMGFFKPRVLFMLGLDGFEEWRKKPFSSALGMDHVRTGGVKLMVHEITGSLHPNPENLRRLVVAVHRAGLQAVVHAIEENHIEAACDAIEHAIREYPRPDHRHRIEHCSVCPPDLAGRLARLGVMVVTQPSFLYYSGDRYLDTVPDGQLKWLYPLATLAKSGVTIAGSSDFPITDPDPIRGIYSAITRMSMGGKTVGPREAIGRRQALSLYTQAAARACFEDDIKGSIRPGMLADFVVLDGDPLTVAADRIKEIRVEMTILGGEVVWIRNG